MILRRTARFRRSGRRLRIEKRFRFDGARRAPAIRLEVQLENVGPAEVVAELAVEWPVMLLGGGANPAAWYEVDGRRSAHDGRAERPGSAEFRVATTSSGCASDDARTGEHGLVVTDRDDLEFRVGFERTYQGSAFVAVWPLRLAPGERIAVPSDQQVEVGRDRSADEAND